MLSRAAEYQPCRAPSPPLHLTIYPRFGHQFQLTLGKPELSFAVSVWGFWKDQGCSQPEDGNGEPPNPDLERADSSSVVVLVIWVF